MKSEAVVQCLFGVCVLGLLGIGIVNLRGIKHSLEDQKKRIDQMDNRAATMAKDITDLKDKIGPMGTDITHLKDAIDRDLNAAHQAGLSYRHSEVCTLHGHKVPCTVIQFHGQALAVLAKHTFMYEKGPKTCVEPVKVEGYTHGWSAVHSGCDIAVIQLTDYPVERASCLSEPALGTVVGFASPHGEKGSSFYMGKIVGVDGCEIVADHPVQGGDSGSGLFGHNCLVGLVSGTHYKPVVTLVDGKAKAPTAEEVQDNMEHALDHWKDGFKDKEGKLSTKRLVQDLQEYVHLTATHATAESVGVVPSLQDKSKWHDAASMPKCADGEGRPKWLHYKHYPAHELR
eukprot:TRINITY_DN1847_c0_g1_i1.p1 TRINITY_DN1847_c0_g1~~TRINITY_DN1847_c0_g1_i1.p1  ORF type:complete len:343 (-),score=22.44 TRINITY_DN1847_c0_g1_i1:109-1137(-)